MDVLPLIYRTFFGLPNTLWLNELRDNYNILSVHGGEAYAENMDKFRTNWFIKYFELIAPR